MIRVRYRAEPLALKASRTKRLPKAIQAFNAHGAGSEQLIARLIGYSSKDVKDSLYADQRKRCAFCERPAGLQYQPIEHLRPKAFALREDPSQEDVERYWWLTWSWENFTFACTTCNGSKGNWFPLERGTVPCPHPVAPLAPGFDPSSISLSHESPLLLDPRNDEPMEHLKWAVADKTPAPSMWQWYLHARTERGRTLMRYVPVAYVSDEVTSVWRDVWKMARQDFRLDGGAVSSSFDVADAWASFVSHVLRDDANFPSARWWMVEEVREMLEATGVKLPAAPFPVCAVT